ncbi:carbohydrate kinase family protein [uncultured Cohaesibacter sp.]|uniref:carbohydrate kinase family protein n=1 Tax=uncultured Cohaesibacter sp. TaxID=1002546 RepID=UPI002AAA7FCE|nr:carbohydrate kinase family protein [uncultured Cohaesibacter sp.]
MEDIVFVGDMSWDETFTVSHFPDPDEKVPASDLTDGFGGVAANSAVAAARAEASVAFMGRVGRDEMSRQANKHMRDHDIRTMLVPAEGMLCRVVSIVEPHGEKRLVLYPGVSIYPEPEDLSNLTLEGSFHLHTAIYGPAGRLLIDMAKKAGLSWSLDLEPATFPEGIEQLEYAIDGASVLFVNDRAAALIGEAPVARLEAMGAHSVVRTRGPLGAEYHAAGTVTHIPAPEGLPVLDTTGAGDCLAGWFLAGLSRGVCPAVALEDAVLAATLSCGAKGAQTAYPTLKQLNHEKEKRAK